MIVKSMIKSGEISDFKLIYYTQVDNNKSKYYFNDLANLAKSSAYVCLNSRFPTNFLRFKNALKHVSAHEETEIAFAGINFFYIQYAVSLYKNIKIYTFDDGAANISPHGPYFHTQRRSIAHDVIGYMLKGSIDQNWIRKSTATHFTIYPGLPNIVDASKLRHIDLINHSSGTESYTTDDKTLKIFFGQPIADLHDDHLSKIYFGMVSKLNIDEYFPHPRETDFTEIGNVVHSNLIAEDYIMSKINTYKNIEIYSLYSSVLLNVVHSKIKKIIIKYPTASRGVSGLYPCFESLGCNFINLKDIIH